MMMIRTKSLYTVTLLNAANHEMARFVVNAWNRREAYFTVMNAVSHRWWDARRRIVK